jgi:outer membrane protein assembly factor BamB
VTRRWFGLALAAAAGLAVGACSVFEDDSETRLEGERISVLDLERKLEPDEQLQNEPVRLPKPYVNASWSQAGGTAAHAMYHLALPEGLTQRWAVDAGAASDMQRPLLAQPVVANGRIIVMDSELVLRAFRVQNGAPIWTRQLNTEDGVFGGGLALANGRVYATTGAGRVHAVDAKTGEMAWTTDVGTPMRAAPAIKDGALYAVTIVNETVALSAEDGSQRWSHQGIEEQSGLLGSASPAVTDSSVLSAYSSGELFALLAENGRDLWSDSLAGVRRTSRISDMADIRGLPVVDRGSVFAVSNSGPMVSIDLRTGARNWSRELASTAMPWAAGDYIYVLTTNSRVAAVRRADGKVRWVTEVAPYEDLEAKEDPIHWSGPMVAGDRVILAGSHGLLAALSPYTGEFLGTMELPGPPAVPPVIAQQTLYVLTRDGTLAAYR